jgi:hypothetical protein
MLPWLFLMFATGFAFDSKPTVGIYIFVWTVWTYPIVVGIAAIFRDRTLFAAYLPFLNLTAFGMALLWKSN